ncbi:hypothetical protein L208DRAFT_1379438 [Tricholoma matsutake]|nr:hypothetical protein L208DRAFT_1379438 [Tricholoma matsutake 945]
MCTADIQTIFKLDKNQMNPDTGKVEEGNWCTLCQNPDHVKLYMMRCNKLNVIANHQALPKSASVTTIDGLIQGSLDGIVNQQPHPPTFSTAGLLNYIIELIVEEDEAFQLVDKGAFC